MKLFVRPNSVLNVGLRVLFPGVARDDSTAGEYSLVSTSGAIVRGLDAICSSVLTASSAILPPMSALERSAASEWTYFALHYAASTASDTSVLEVSALRSLSGRLLRATFLADTLSPTFCDVLVYAAVRDGVRTHSGLLHKELSYYPLFRWIGTIEALPEVAAVIPDGNKISLPIAAPEPPAVPNKTLSPGGVNKPSEEEIAARRQEKKSLAVEQQRTAGAPQQQPAPKSKVDAPAPLHPEEVLELRVGRILSARRHESAESLYVESIDVGEPAPRQIVSGLVKWVTESDLVGHDVLILCNLKPAKMRGIESQGMVMCAVSSDETRLEVLSPPSGSRPGDRVTFPGGDSNRPAAEQKVAQIPPKKLSDYLAPLRTDANGVPQWNAATGALPFTLPGGTIKTAIPNGIVR